MLAKSVTVTLLAIAVALLVNVSSIQESRKEIVQVKDSKDAVSGGKKVPPRKIAEQRFVTSRSRKAQQQVVLDYARWYAKNKLGYTKAQWEKVRDMWYKESRWDWDAVNESSGAKGIAQMKTTSDIKNPFRQVELGFKYIKHRYGGPDEAAKHWEENGNY